jgi:hypothetical protein
VKILFALVIALITTQGMATHASVCPDHVAPSLLATSEPFQKFYTLFKERMTVFSNMYRRISIEETRSIVDLVRYRERREAFIRGDIDEIRKTNIPEELWSFFSKETGEFIYRRKHPLSFSSESGRQELKVVRIGFFRKDWRERIVTSYAEAMDKIPGFDLWVSSRSEDIEYLEGILSKLPKEIRNRIKISQTDGMTGKNVWTQDGSKPLSSSSPAAATPAVKVHPVYDATIEALKATQKLSVIQSLFKFEGGNVIVGERNLFIGTTDVYQNMNRLHCSRKEILAALEQEFGLPVIEIGGGMPEQNGAISYPSQQDYHIDLSMALVYDHVKKKEVVLLESPEKFVNYLADKPESSFRSKEERYFLNLIRDGQLSSMTAVNRQGYLDAVGKKLESEGYEVLRIPGYNEDAQKMINFTNAIFSGRNAIIPETGFTELDESYKKILSSMGYKTIVSMKLVQEMKKMQGGIRCFSETYRRGHVEWTPPLGER